MRVIGPDGNQVGILPLEEALKLAQSHDLDLVEVAPTSQPPVCRIMDYGKFKYEQKKKAFQSKKRSAVVQMKEIKMRPKTNEHDLQFKVRHIKEFLASGKKTKVSVMFRGREIVHAGLGKAMMERILDEVKELANLEMAPRLEGRTMIMVLAPRG